MMTVAPANIDPEAELRVMQASLRLLRYRKACDRARARRLQTSPRLARVIAALLDSNPVPTDAATP
jgi:hypothetical protein